MAGIIKSMYDALVTAICGKTTNNNGDTTYASQVGLDKTLPYTYKLPLPEISSGSTSFAKYYDLNHSRTTNFSSSEKLPSYEFIGLQKIDLGDDAPLAKIALKNEQCNVGLLAVPPVYHNGDATLTKGGVSYTNSYPALRFTTTSGYKPFLEVQEIPNQSFDGYLTLATQDAELDPSKYFNGLYWDSYHRYQLTARSTSFNAIAESPQSASDKEAWCAQVTISGGNAADFDELKYSYSYGRDDTIQDYKYDVHIYNPNAIYIGENTNGKAWPAVKYFGFFSKPDGSTALAINYDDPTQKFLYDNSLYYWGELTQSAQWYHVTTDTAAQEGKTYYTRSGSAPNYTFTEWDPEGEIPFVTANMYEKLGIIVNPAQGGIFGKNKFIIKWDSDIISNAFA